MAYALILFLEQRNIGFRFFTLFHVLCKTQNFIPQSRFLNLKPNNGPRAYRSVSHQLNSQTPTRPPRLPRRRTRPPASTPSASPRRLSLPSACPFVRLFAGLLVRPHARPPARSPRSYVIFSKRSCPLLLRSYRMYVRPLLVGRMTTAHGMDRSSARRTKYPLRVRGNIHLFYNRNLLRCEHCNTLLPSRQ